MSVATLSDSLPGVPIAEPKTRWFKAPDTEDDPANALDFDNWPKAARRLWKILLRRARVAGTKVITLPVWKLAELCGRGLRWAWKALRQLLKLGVIRRFWISGRQEVENRKGHHGEVGRATEILIDFAGPEPKVKPAPKSKDKPPTSTGTGALAKIKAMIAGATQPAGDPQQDGPSPPASNWRDHLPASSTPPPPPPPVPQQQRRRNLGIDRNDPKAVAILAEMEAKDAARRERERQAANPSDQLPAESAGPEVPAPDSGS